MPHEAYDLEVYDGSSLTILETATAVEVVVEMTDAPVVLGVATDVVEVTEAGPQGPPGAAGGASAPPTEHIVTVATATWIVNHNLGYYPIVEIIDADGARSFPDVVHSNVNSYSVIHPAPVTGRALSR